MRVQQLVDYLQRIVAEYGHDIIVEARNVAGDMTPLDPQGGVEVAVSWQGVTTVQIDP